MNLKILAVLGLTLPLLGACGGGCGITTDNNLVRIVSAQYADGTPIPEVQLLAAPTGITVGNNQTQGLRSENGTILCTVGCAFGRPGQYTVTVGAPGAVPQQVQVNVPGQYVKEGGGGPFAGCGYNRYTGTPQEVRLVFERE